MFKLKSKSINSKVNPKSNNPFTTKISTNCDPNPNKYNELTQVRLSQYPPIYYYRKVENPYQYNISSVDLKYSNRKSNEEIFTDKVKDIINKESGGTITLQDILSQSSKKDNLKPNGYPYFFYLNKHPILLKSMNNLPRKLNINFMKKINNEGDRNLRTNPSPYISNNKNGNDNYEENINKQNYEDEKNNGFENIRYEPNVNNINQVDNEKNNDVKEPNNNLIERENNNNQNPENINNNNEKQQETNENNINEITKENNNEQIIENTNNNLNEPQRENLENLKTENDEKNYNENYNDDEEELNEFTSQFNYNNNLQFKYNNYNTHHDPKKIKFPRNIYPLLTEREEIQYKYYESDPLLLKDDDLFKKKSGEKNIFRNHRQLTDFEGKLHMTSESNSSWIPRIPKRTTYNNYTSVQYNIISPGKKSVFKTKDEINGIKITNRVKSVSEFVDVNRIDAVNLSDLFANSVKDKHWFKRTDQVGANHSDLHLTYRERIPHTFS